MSGTFPGLRLRHWRTYRRTGTLALISEVGGSRSAREDATYLRKTDGSPPVRLADTGPVKLSPDGKWVVSAAESGEFILLPTGAGEHRALDLKGFQRIYWYPDSRRLLLSGDRPGPKSRCYSLDIKNGARESVTPDGVVCGLAPSPDGTTLLVKTQQSAWLTYSLRTSEMRAVDGLASSDESDAMGSR